MIEWLKYYIGEVGIYLIAFFIVNTLINVANKYGNWFFDGDFIVAFLVLVIVKEIILKKE